MRLALWCLPCGLWASVPPEMMGSAVGKKPMRLAKTEPYVRCATCRLAAHEAWASVALRATELRALGEVEIGEVLDTVCDPDDDLGEWITYYDIEQKERLGHGVRHLKKRLPSGVKVLESIAKRGISFRSRLVSGLPCGSPASYRVGRVPS